MASETHTTFCRICEALCGLEVTVEDGEITRIRPDEAHIATAGFGCLKGLKQHRMYGSPDRLQYPEKRVGDRWERISWEQAIHEIGARVRSLRNLAGPDSIAMYVGTAAGFGVLHPVFAQGFMLGVGSKSMYSSATQDCSNKFAVSREMYGFPFTLPFPDVERTRCLIVVGANPVVSKWSFLQVPNPTRKLRDIIERGGQVFVVDPRRTETARAAGEHVFIRPGTDVFFYLAFLRELIHQKGIDQARVERYTTGFDQITRLVEPWTPERAAVVTRIPPETLRRMVAAYRAADGAALYLSTGVNMGARGSLAYWLQEVINAASGNLDRAGGTLVGRGVIDFARFGVKTGTLMRSDRSRIGQFQAVNDGYPGGLLADEILTPGPRQVRALFVTGGNPLLTMANSGRLKQAFEQLELLVTLDIYRNETGSIAHYTLPTTSPLERPDLPFIFPLMLGLQTRPYLQATRAVVQPRGEQREEASIYLDLCRASGAPLFGSRIAQRFFELLMDRHSRKHPGRPRELPSEALLDGLLRLCGQPGFASLLERPHGWLRAPHRADDFLDRRVYTDDRKVHLAPAPLLRQAQALEQIFADEKAQANRLKLITRRHVTTHNSWTHNIDDFVKDHDRTNHLYLHPDDASELGLREGDLADVSTDTATVRVPVRLSAELMRGAAALPHGWGHQHATGLRVASNTRGVNVNLLAADGPGKLDTVSGMAHLTGLLIDVRPAAGPQNPASWSGI